jgi:hypothetical protein
MADKTQTSVYIRRGQISTVSDPRPDSMHIRNFKPPNRLVGGRQILRIQFLSPTHQFILSDHCGIRKIPSFIVTSSLDRQGSQFRTRSLTVITLRRPFFSGSCFSREQLPSTSGYEESGPALKQLAAASKRKGDVLHD